MSLHYSAIESNRFGLRVFRGSPTQLNIDELLHTIEAERIDVAILRLPTKEQHILSQLSGSPFQVIVADTVLTLSTDMRSFPPPPLRNPRLVVRRATADDQLVLEELVEVVFDNYHTHYNSNPLFASHLVLAGYKEWALDFLHSTTDEKSCFLFYLDNRPIAFTTIALHAAYGDGILIGARPGATSPGLGGDLIRHIKHHTLSHGRKRVQGTTQVQNHGVQRVLINEGFRPAESHYTVHINALLSQKA